MNLMNLVRLKREKQDKYFDESRYADNLYYFLPLVFELFKGPYQVFVNTNAPHILSLTDADIAFVKEVEDTIYKKRVAYELTHPDYFTVPEYRLEDIRLSHGLIYNNVTDEQKAYILSLMPLEHQVILSNWLKDTMARNNVPFSEQGALTKQFLIEGILHPLIATIYKKKTKRFIDVYHRYELIDNLPECSQERRKEFTEHLKNEQEDRGDSYTAVGKIECIGGVYQWD